MVLSAPAVLCGFPGGGSATSPSAHCFEPAPLLPGEPLTRLSSEGLIGLVLLLHQVGSSTFYSSSTRAVCSYVWTGLAVLPRYIPYSSKDGQPFSPPTGKRLPYYTEGSHTAMLPKWARVSKITPPPPPPFPPSQAQRDDIF
jgi:hypothetical protein